MRKLQNTPALIFATVFLALLISRLGKADAFDIVFYGLAVFALLLIFVASNVKPKKQYEEQYKEKASRRSILLVGAIAFASMAVLVSLLFF